MTTLIIILFVIGYLAVAAEHSLGINKAASALITGVLCWTVYALQSADAHMASEQLLHGLGEMSGILFFLLGAMTVVELIDAHNGFDLITSRITATSKTKLLWIVSIITFLLSPLLDNLTTTIVLVSLVRKLVADEKDRLYFIGMIIIASNAGGCWSPIGDVTTTMLWIGGQITPANIIAKLLLPGLVCMLAPLMILSARMKGHVTTPTFAGGKQDSLPRKEQGIVLVSGLLILILVPVFKSVTHLPPFMGMLLGLGILWVITELLHKKRHHDNRQYYSVAYALQKIDTPSILFFLGILSAIHVLEITGVLGSMASYMTQVLGNTHVIVLVMGLLSSVIDNVPLVAATQAMYSLADYPTDHYFWEFIAYSTGTGGSALIIGSAAGVAAMGMEKITFMWYLRRMTPLALIGFFAGAAVYLLQLSLGF